MTNPQTAINDAYEMTKKSGQPAYVYGGATVLKPPYAVTKNQPSRFRSHWMITTDGRLWHYRTPIIDGTNPEKISKEIKYTEIK